MAKIAVHNQSGDKVGEVNLPAEIFEVTPKMAVLHQALVAQMANARSPWAHTKTRGEVRGGGKKPWKQKGTGRARVGSIRSPIWIGGGTTFGPRKQRDYSQKMNAKARRKALLMALTSKVQDKQLVILDELKLSQPKTKELAIILAKLPVAGKTTLVALSGQKDDVLLYRAGRNIPIIKLTRADSLNVKDLLDYEDLLLLKASIPVISRVFGGRPSRSVRKQSQVAVAKKPAAKAKPTAKKTVKPAAKKPVKK